MSEERGTSLPVIKEEKETKGGGYFVSNYPPYSHWSHEATKQGVQVLEEPGNPDTPLGLYVHIPFCRKRCHFCYFKVYTDKNAAAIKAYTDAVVQELRHFASKPVINGRKLDFVYFGGGTPSYLSAKQLKAFTDGLKSVLPWDDVREVTFECEPGTLNEKKLAAIREFGVTRLSLGIEHFDDYVLETNGRAHLSKQVYAAYEAARNVDFPQINIDLIAGMLEETEERWQENIKKTLELAPDSVTIYQMEVPFNTTIYKRMRDEGKLSAPVADWDTKRRWVDEAFTALEDVGYHVSSAYTVVKEPTQQFLYRDQLFSGADLLGTGVASFGHVKGVHLQNHKDIDPYVKMVNDGQWPLYRGYVTNEEERLIRETVLRLKRGYLERGYYSEKYGVDVVEHWREVFDAYEARGLLTISEDRVNLTRKGLLRVDSLLPAFFLKEHREG